MSSNTAVTTAPPRVSQSAIEAAVIALLKYKASQSANEKLQLLPRDDYLYLNLTLKRIPSNPRTNPYKIPLSNPVLEASGSEVCLIVDDRPGTTTPPSDQIKKLIKSQDIPISKVIKLSKLKANYKPFEARRKLCNSYDVFLVDKRVVHLLPKLIGKELFRKKKLPLGVDMGKKNLKLQVERVLGSALLFIGTGTCSVLKVGKMEMEKDEIVQNVLDAIKGAVERVPKKWDGVRSLHLKFSDSVALPIYQAMPDVRLKIEGLKDIEEEGEVTEVSDCDSSKSRKKKQKTKGRIHEVRYMDIGEDVDSDIADLDESEVREEGFEDVVMQSSDDEGKKTENEEMRIVESVGKRRRMEEGKKKKSECGRKLSSKVKDVKRKKSKSAIKI
ncbi:ribosomal L1 domain-containing protein 1-like [Salvia hispanica]|uniref:ribosomal L1 domain-containing protein 1-like n=1 Tax=Salvia hispanica TaxID=49212 RepID=UPI00200905FE|nr:ribosomal L1 domain-containing protein 1-like [Salvia hispanica]XP_047938771.1 ribosomal L1 domain-containing protein 1-like [Salvia hispanica]